MCKEEFEQLRFAQNPDSKTAEQYSARNRFVRELMALGITFDHYGGCKYGTEGNAAHLPPPHKEGTHYHGLEAQRRKVQLLKHYKFVLGLENIVQVDYVTEKFYQLFATGCAPILHKALLIYDLWPLTENFDANVSLPSYWLSRGGAAQQCSQWS